MAHFDLSYWHATIKTYAYFREFGFFRIFFCQKSDPIMVKSHFKNTMENPFFEVPFFLDKTLQIFFYNSNYIGLCLKTAFRNNFGPWEVPKLENLHFHFHAFSGWGTSQGPKLFLKAFFTQSPI